MSRSRTVVLRRQRLKRRRKLIAANVVLLAAICAVALWNGLFSPFGTDTGQAVESPRGEQGVSEEGDSHSESDEPEPGTDSDHKSALPEEPVMDNEPALPGESVASNDSERVSLAFVGDVLLGEYVETLLYRHGFDYPYEHVNDILQKADFAAANMETAIVSNREKPGLKTYEFRSDPDALPAFHEAGFDLVSLANNHAMDYGADGLRETMQHLKESEIAHVGAGENADDAYAPVYIEKNGLRIAVLGFSRVVPFVEWKVGKNTLGIAETYDYTRPVEAIKSAKAEADIVVVMVHWGDERTALPLPDEQVDLGHRYIDAGADLVIGSHPHVLQGFEYYKDRWIAYSLGNFIFTKSKDPLTYDSGILQAECRKGGACELQLTPMRADTPQPQPMSAEKIAELLARLSKLSYGASIDEEGHIMAKTNE
jgi:poly-gamma-glutamate capsule biosynthesis protein CapA/YwtB (metallophosphatase superfamily)